MSSPAQQILLILIIVGCITTPLIAAEHDSVHLSIEDRLTGIGLLVERRIRMARFNTAGGVVDAVVLQNQAHAAHDALSGIERELHLLGDDASATTTAKLKSLQLLAHNLSLIARTGALPPLRGDRSRTPVRIRTHRPGKTTEPSNNNCESATPVDFGSFTGSLESATNDGQASCGASLYSPDVWFRFDAQAPGTIVVDTVGSSFDTVLSIHSECPGTIENQLGCNDDDLGLQSALGVSVEAGSSYWIRVSGANGSIGDYTLTISTGGGFSGTVTAADDGAPVPAAVRVYDSSGFFFGSASTDDLGTYEIDTLFAGTWYAVTEHSSTEAFVDQLFDGHHCPGGPVSGCEVVDGDGIAVATNSIRPGIDFELATLGIIAGSVVDDLIGLPVDAARVEIYDSEAQQVAWDYADATGDFSFNLPAGTYYCTADSPDHLEEGFANVPCLGGINEGCQIDELTPLVIEYSTQVQNVSFSLRRLAHFGGRVTYRMFGNPMEGVPVRVYDHEHTFIETVYTLADGSYSVGGLYDGEYFASGGEFTYNQPQMYDGIDCASTDCDLSLASPIVIADQAAVTGIDFDLINLGTISGTVFEADGITPVEGVEVVLHNPSVPGWRTTESNADGRYGFSRVFEGAYFLTSADHEYYGQLYENMPCPAGCDWASGTPVLATNGHPTTDIDFKLIPKGRITGSVVDDITSEPINGIFVALYNAHGTYLRGLYSSTNEYTIVGLEQGTYFVTARQQHSYFETLYDGFVCEDDCDVTTGTPVEVAEATTTTGIDFRLKPHGVVSGQVTDTELNPLSNAHVYAINEDTGRQWEDPYITGDYSISGLPPGQYRVVVDARFHRDQVWEGFGCASEYPAGCDDTGATLVTVDFGQTSIADFRLEPLPTITGAVHSAGTDDPLRYILVQYSTEAGVTHGYTRTASDGSYSFDGIWPGRYFVTSADSGPTYVDQVFDDIQCPGGPPDGCTPHEVGTPIDVSFSSGFVTADLDLVRFGTLEGTVTDEVTGSAIYRTRVQAWDAEGVRVGSDDTDSQGRFRIPGLVSGTYFVTTRQFGAPFNIDYVDESYDSIPCWSGPPGGCDPSKGTPVDVTVGSTTRFVDFSLAPVEGAIAGRVVDATSGDPLQEIAIDLWEKASGSHRASALTNSAGAYLIPLEPGEYFCSTDNTQGWINLIWEGVECFGSPYDDDCDPTVGDSVVISPNSITSDIDFHLRRSGGFEDDRPEERDLDIESH